MAKDTFYFSHDYNTRTDEKIKQILRKFGMEGYGIFWCIIEDLYNNANAMRLDCEGIAYELRTDINMVKSIVYDCGLFEIDGEIFGSMSIERRLNERIEKSKSAKRSAEIRWKNHKHDANAQENDANAMRTQCDSNARKERKGKERKGKDSVRSFAPPSPDEALSYFQSKNYHNPEEEAIKFWNYYESNGWRVGKNPMKSWQSAAANWNTNTLKFNTDKNGDSNGKAKRNYSPTYESTLRRAKILGLDTNSDIFTETFERT